MFNREHVPNASTASAAAIMVESNRDEQRLARIEQVVERLQREQALLTILKGKLIAAAVTKPSVLVTYNRTRRKIA